MKKIYAVLAILAVGVLSGCSTAPSMAQLAKDSADASQIRAKQMQEQREQQQKAMEDSLAKIPSWALEAPHPDGTGVYAVGFGASDLVNIALHKAMLDGEFGLAKVYAQELSGSERSYNKDEGGRTTGSQYTELVDKLVTQVPVTGFEVVHQEVKVIDGKYQSYVLLKLPYDQFNAVIKEQASKASNATVEKEFNDLERRVEKRRQQRKEDEAAKSAPAPVMAPATSTTVTTNAASSTSDSVKVEE